MDSLVEVKINEALYELKEKLLCVEEQFSKISEEKAKMETILKEKVEMIRVCLHMCIAACCFNRYFFLEIINVRTQGSLWRQGSFYRFTWV